MKEQEKQQIVGAAEQHRERLGLSGSQVARLVGFSEATYSKLRNGIWADISEIQFRKLADWCGYSRKEMGWQTASITNYNKIVNLCALSQGQGIKFAIADEPGRGKSYALREYAHAHKDTYYIECHEYFTKKTFLVELGKKIGKGEKFEGLRVDEMMRELQSSLRRGVLLIIDEADKLRDSLLSIVKILVDDNTDAGVVICGAPYLRKRIEGGVVRNKQSYKEIYSRVGREFIGLATPSRKDVAEICKQNGLESEAVVGQIWSEVSKSGDLRLLKRLIEKEKIKNLMRA